MSLNECIGYLDKNYAKLPDNREIQDIQKAIEETVSLLLLNVASNDPRFESKLEPSGSFYEGTKIKQADEFDFMVCLSKLAGKCDVVYKDRKQRYIYLRIPTLDEDEIRNSWSELCEEVHNVVDPFDTAPTADGHTFLCLDSSMLKQRFFSLLREAFKSITWPSNIKLLSSTGLTFDRLKLRGAMQTAASEKVDLLWKDHLKVSVDLCVAVECKGWPLLSGMFDSLIDEGHPALLIKNKIKSSGFHAVTKVGTIWRISWSRAEITMLKYIFSENEKAAVVYRVAKLINETHFVEACEHTSISASISICDTFSLKHLLMCYFMSNFLCCEKDCGEMLLDLLYLLLDGLTTGNCPLLFLNDASSLKSGPLLQSKAVALKQCINNLLSMQVADISQVSKISNNFFGGRIPVVVPSPPRKIRSYKITKIP